MTNYEKIKAMSIDKMAVFFEHIDFCPHSYPYGTTEYCNCEKGCVPCIKNWLLEGDEQ